jgi:hypothetical protein
MPIIIKIGRLPELLWALVVLVGFILVSSGILHVINGISCFANDSSAVFSQLRGSIFIFYLGLIVISLGYFGVLGKIIFVR